MNELQNTTQKENNTMNSTKHTPGPWQATRGLQFWAIESQKPGIHPGWKDRIGTIPDYMELDGIHCGSINVQNKTQEELDANARLIAAAPELLEALKATRSALLDWVDIAEDHDMRESDYDALNLSRVAIAKAEGAEA